MKGNHIPQPKHFVIVFEVISEYFSIWAFMFVSYFALICRNQLTRVFKENVALLN